MYKKRYSNGKTSIYRRNRKYDQYNLYGGADSINDNTIMAYLIKYMAKKIFDGIYKGDDENVIFDNFFAESGFVGDNNKKEKFKRIFRENLNLTSEMQPPDLKENIEGKLKEATLGTILCDKTGNIVEKVINIIDDDKDAMVLEMFPFKCDDGNLTEFESDKTKTKIKAYFTYEKFLPFEGLMDFQNSQDTDFFRHDVVDDKIIFSTYKKSEKVIKLFPKIKTTSREIDMIKDYLLVGAALKGANIGSHQSENINDSLDFRPQVAFVMGELSGAIPIDDGKRKGEGKGEGKESVDQLLEEILIDSEKTKNLIKLYLDKGFDAELTQNEINKNSELKKVFQGSSSGGKLSIEMEDDNDDATTNDDVKNLLLKKFTNENNIINELKKL